MSVEFVKGRKLLELHAEQLEKKPTLYYYGVYNGLELMLSMIEGRDPLYKSPKGETNGELTGLD